MDARAIAAGRLGSRSVGEGFALGLERLVAVAAWWWERWLKAPRRLAGGDPATFVNHR